MILILFPYHFLKNVIFMREFVQEFLANFVHEFKYEIRTNSYEFFARKIGYITNGLYCTEVDVDRAEEHIMRIKQDLCCVGEEVPSQGIVVDRVIH